jgi:hypothetical protein
LNFWYRFRRVFRCDAGRHWPMAPVHGTNRRTTMHMGTTELFLIAMTAIVGIPYLVWRLGDTDYWAPLVVVQTLTGIVLGPGIMGKPFRRTTASCSRQP